MDVLRSSFRLDSIYTPSSRSAVFLRGDIPLSPPPLTRWWWIKVRAVYPVVQVNRLEIKRKLSFLQLESHWRSQMISCPPRLLHLYSLEVYPGVYRIQLAVQGVEGRSLRRFCGPAVHHDAVDVLWTAGWTGQSEPRRQQV